MPRIGLLGARTLAALFAVTVVGACSSGPPPPSSITLTLVRHAQSEGNASGLVDTSVPGPGLTPEGKQQAEDLADELRGKDFDGIYASNMLRAEQTAAPLAAELGEQVQVLDGLREIEAGWFEGKPEDQIATTYFLAPAQWLDGNMDATIPGSVSGKEFNDRFTGAVQEIYASGDKNPVAVAHAGSIMLWTQLNATNSQESLIVNRPLPNTGVVVLEGNPTTGWRLISWDGLSL
ncbi:histidine phosphatase family protein [Mycolicibacterium chitae]|uniref:LpqD n=1 Tax=Mycolicibacterium chitae TaxID=1792 RepID=A0A3S4TNZ6_MYCCI|nr:histidine phosphatase family protein [Mycolicibacterium chitae]MCV7106796.1 histidine phosphatase family protein [Mycolicibacterium chitae]BBZ05749.1 histidine phosphatase family protein [Mycolicibacterium chitae]VEG49359.1 lpqD [Mycolicibacterium chitae]